MKRALYMMFTALFTLCAVQSACSSTPEELLYPTDELTPEPEPEPTLEPELEPTPEPNPEPEPTPRYNNPASFLGLGWNLGNQFDAYNDGVSAETAWGNKPVTQATMDAVKAAGFKSVRIPVTWLGHIGDAPSYTIDSSWLDRVSEAVTYAENAGLNAIINIHHDGADSNHWLNIKEASKSEETNKQITEELTALWTQIANKFANKGDFLVFESMNEIHDGGWGWGDNRKDNGKQYAVLNGWNQAFVDAVRATGGNNATRWLATPTYCTNIDLGDYFEIPNDPGVDNRIIVAVHCYDPYEYAINATYPQWGHYGEVGKKPSEGEKELVASLDKIVDKWVSKEIPVYIGEFGSVHRSDARSEKIRQYYLEYYSKAASDRSIPIFYWDNGGTGSGKEQFGIFDHSTGAWINNGEETAGSMSRGYNITDPDYTLETVYRTAP